MALSSLSVLIRVHPCHRIPPSYGVTLSLRGNDAAVVPMSFRMIGRRFERVAVVPTGMIEFERRGVRPLPPTRSAGNA